MTGVESLERIKDRDSVANIQKLTREFVKKIYEMMV